MIIKLNSGLSLYCIIKKIRKVKVVGVHSMKVYGKVRGTDPVILKLRTRWRCLMRVKLRPLYLRGKKA